MGAGGAGIWAAVGFVALAVAIGGVVGSLAAWLFV